MHLSASNENHPWSISGRTALDDAGIAMILNEQEGDSRLVEVAEVTLRFDEMLAESEVWVAKNKCETLGFASLSPAWWSAGSNDYQLELRVGRSHLRKGVGSSLYKVALKRLQALQSRDVSAWIREDSAPARAFAGQRESSETGEVDQDYMLELSRANLQGHHDLEARLAASGVALHSLAELQPTEAFLHQLQDLWSGLSDDEDAAAQPGLPFETWRSKVLDGPGLSPEMHWVAVAGERPVGMTFLKLLNDRAAENDYTTVSATLRGRGIATALKVRAIQWGRRHGVGRFYTSSDVTNTPMIKVHHKLGYVPGVRRLQVVLHM